MTKKKKTKDPLQQVMEQELDRWNENVEKEQAAKKNKKKKSSDTEPLSTFQDLKKTKRVDPLSDDEENINESIDVPAREFTKISLRNQIFIDTEFVDNDKDKSGTVVRNPGTKDWNWPIHEDLKAAFARFRAHMIFLCGYVDHKKVKTDIEDFKSPLLEYFTCTSVSLTAKADGLTISGNRKVGNKVFNFSAPLGRFDDKDYAFGGDLEAAWENLCKETLAYTTEQKFGEGKQVDILFNKKEESYSEEAL